MIAARLPGWAYWPSPGHGRNGILSIGPEEFIRIRGFILGPFWRSCELGVGSFHSPFKWNFFAGTFGDWTAKQVREQAGESCLCGGCSGEGMGKMQTSKMENQNGRESGE